MSVFSTQSLAVVVAGMSRVGVRGSFFSCTRCRIAILVITLVFRGYLQREVFSGNQLPLFSPWLFLSSLLLALLWNSVLSGRWSVASELGGSLYAASSHQM